MSNDGEPPGAGARPGWTVVTTAAPRPPDAPLGIADLSAAPAPAVAADEEETRRYTRSPRDVLRLTVYTAAAWW